MTETTTKSLNIITLETEPVISDPLVQLYPSGDEEPLESPSLDRTSIAARLRLAAQLVELGCAYESNYDSTSPRYFTLSLTALRKLLNRYSIDSSAVTLAQLLKGLSLAEGLPPVQLRTVLGGDVWHENADFSSSEIDTIVYRAARYQLQDDGTFKLV